MTQSRDLLRYDLLNWQRLPRSVLTVILAGVTILVYANTLGHDFAYDDWLVIVDNPGVRHADWRALWLRGYWGHVTGGGGNYRPLTVTTFAVEYWLWGARPAGYHLTNVLIHAANVAWLFVLLQRYRVTAGVAGLAALIFAVHPVHTEAVANVVGRSELLGMFLGGLMWWMWLNGRSGGAVGWAWRSSAGLAYLAAVFSKENMIVLPAALFVAEWLAGRHTQKSPGSSGSWLGWAWLRRNGWTFGVFVLALGPYFGLRALAGEGVTQAVEVGQVPLAGRTLWERLVIMLGVGLTWYRLVVVGYPLQILYGIREFDLTPMLHWRVVVGAVVTAGLLGAAAVCLRRMPLVTFAIAFWFITLAVTSNVLLPVGALLAERWLYLPSVAAALALSAGCVQGIRVGGLTRTAALAGMAGLLTFYSLVTVLRNRDWRNNVTIFESLIATAPQNPSGYMMLGHELMDTDPQRARDLQEAALRIDPEFLSPQGSLAELDLRTGNISTARDRFARLLTQEPPNLPTPSGEWADWHALYAKSLALTGDLPAALEQAQIALRQSPHSLIVLFETSQVFLQAGQVEAALAGLRQLTVYDRDSNRAYSNLATVLIELERYAEAEDVLLQGLKLVPQSEPLQARLKFVRQKQVATNSANTPPSSGVSP